LHPHPPGQTGGLGQLLHLGQQVAGGLRHARWPGRALGPFVVADKDVAFEYGQAETLLTSGCI
jgi:hypothetical protein